VALCRQSKASNLFCLTYCDIVDRLVTRLVFRDLTTDTQTRMHRTSCIGLCL